MESNNNKLVEFFKNIPIPDVIKYNAITAFSKGVGKIIDGAFDIPVAYLENRAKVIRARGEAEVKLISSASDSAAALFITDSELANRALSRFGKDIIESQINRENTASRTLDQLSSMGIGADTTEKIDDDWLTIFWNLAGTKSSEDVQEILAKILAKEIVKPKSVSPNTLNLLSVLTSDLGLALSRLSSLSIDDGKSCYVIHPHVFAFQNIGPLEEYGVSYDDLFELDGSKLIRSAETLMLNYAKGKPEFEKVNYAGIEAELNLVGAQVNLIQFTKSGRELRNLIKLSENKGYTKILSEKFKESFVIK